MIPKDKNLFGETLDACSDTLKDYKPILLDIYSKGVHQLDIIFKFRCGEVAVMNINADCLVKNITKNIEERRNLNDSKSNL